MLCLQRKNNEGLKMTLVDYICCSSCGFEAFDIKIEFVRTVANGGVYKCPCCEKETMDVQSGDEFT